MTSGGARNRSGSAPDPHSARSSTREWRTLPAAGRAGPAPDWPLISPLKRELELWELLWRKPQAILWEQNGLEFEVAMHVRTLAVAEKRGAATNTRTLLRQQADALYLTMPALRAATVKIGTYAERRPVAGEPGDVDDPAPAEPTIDRGATVTDIRDRLSGDGAD